MGNKFKKGDRVQVINTNGGPYQQGTMHMFGTVDEDDTTPWVKLDNGKSIPYHQDRLRLVPVQNFKRGDRVRVVNINETNYRQKGTLGMLGTVADGCVICPAVKLEDGRVIDYLPERLELVHNQIADAEAVEHAKSKADKLLAALTAAKARVNAATQRYSCAEKELESARKELLAAEHAEDAVRDAIYQAA